MQHLFEPFFTTKPKAKARGRAGDRDGIAARNGKRQCVQ